ncbi:hypothetical protein FRC10_005627 [Ceratobasidium sp. 414]|nr:hypothetical protein FRC10_005627 [Ceratobasidium sp. 414]
MYIVSGSGDQTVRIWDAYRAQNQGNSTGRAGVDLGSADDATSVTHTQLSAQHKDLPTPTLQPLALHGHMYDLAFDIWELDEDGWVITDGSKLLAWIPLDLRSCLPRRPNTNILSRHGELRLDFSGAKLGDAWQQCYVHLG